MTETLISPSDLFRQLCNDQDEARELLQVKGSKFTDAEATFTRGKAVAFSQAIDMLASSNFVMNNPPTDRFVYEKILESYKIRKESLATSLVNRHTNEGNPLLQGNDSGIDIVIDRVTAALV